MKKLMALLVLLGTLGTDSLFTSCKNNGGVHVKSHVSICAFNNKESYSPQMAGRIYDAKENCKRCGCASKDHTAATKPTKKNKRKT